MPCYTPEPTAEEMNRAGLLHEGQFPAILCGILSAHGEGILSAVDWQRAGVNEALVRSWWTRHQKRDAERKG